MRISLKSIYFQVLISFLLIIMSNLIISTVIEYYTYTAQLPRLITEIRIKSIAQHLSSTYTRDQNWNNLDIEIQRINNLESLNTLEDANLRIIIRDRKGQTIYNSFLNITRLGNSELIEGESQTIIDYKTEEPVGVVTIYISRDYVLKHAQSYISELIESGIFKGLITAAIAFIISLLLSRRITRPVIQLTDAAQRIAENKESSPIASSSTNELDRLSDTFNSMLSSLQNQRELRKQLISEISHEINTPLNTIRLEARALSDGLVNPGEASNIIINEIDSLKNLIYDLDWLAETDSGAYILKKEKCSIYKLLAEVVKRRQPRAETRNLKLILGEYTGFLPVVMIDAVRISTALSNLIDNAIKYSPEQGQINIGCELTNKTIVISVCDDGKPIAPEHRQHIFERFYRENRRATAGVGGRGLGLFIVKQIVELHQGKILLECGEEKGNCFLFSLPESLFTE
ncbi:MAG TPA: hypothetical protein DCO79_00105 [Spirochaeta sp.]|nr:hypothetical protein [Spirochaeta sp.]